MLAFKLVTQSHHDLSLTINVVLWKVELLKLVLLDKILTFWRTLKLEFNHKTVNVIN